MRRPLCQRRRCGRLIAHAGARSHYCKALDGSRWRYTILLHRVAISNSRLVEFTGDEVAFRAGRTTGTSRSTRCRRRVRTALPVARAARWVPAHPALRAVGQSQPRGQAAALSQIAAGVHARARTARRARGLSRPLPEAADRRITQHADHPPSFANRVSRRSSSRANATRRRFNTHNLPPPERRFSPTGSFAHRTRAVSSRAALVPMSAYSEMASTAGEPRGPPARMARNLPCS
jgi:hypothetical protein